MVIRLAEQNLPLAMRHSVWLKSALCVACLGTPVLAASNHSSGDGSGADNEQFSPGTPSRQVADDGAALREPYDPFFDIDWSTALRGSYIVDDDDERFEVILVPTISFDHQGSRSAINFSGSADIVRPDREDIDIRGLRLNASGGYALDSLTALTSNGNFSLTQQSRATPGLASDVEVAPETWTGGADLGITRQFGRFNLGIASAVQRSTYGDTTWTDGTVVDNSDQNLWSANTSLRLGFEATPIFEIFGQGTVGREVFDRPSSVSSVNADATDTAIEGGVTARWSETLEATASTGLNLRRFDDASLGEFSTQLFDAEVIFTPNSTWRFAAGFSTTVGAPGPDRDGLSQVEYAADLDVGYTVNSWLALRAMADWSTTRYAGSDQTDEEYGWGMGADYSINSHADLTADYAYTRSDSSSTGVQDAHTISMGVTLSR